MPITGTAAGGRLAASKGALYTATRFTEVPLITLGNAAGTATSVFVELYVKPKGGTSKIIYSSTLATAPAVVKPIGQGEVLCLNPLDVVEGIAGVGDAVDYLICKREV